jgi:predicted Rossmann fold flavoprotein
MEHVDVLIIGAGAAGLMCAIEAGKRQRKVKVIDHANKAGKKILMSGGGRCNFTNYYVTPANYLSQNPHFCKSALSRYTQWDFIDLIQRHKIPFHEKSQGQLFCDHKAKDIVNMLLLECAAIQVDISLNTSINNISHQAHGFIIVTEQGKICAQSLVVASGGLSIPTMGASPLGYKIAQQFGIKVWPTRAALVPLTLQEADKARLATLAGIAVESTVSCKQQAFKDGLLFTHRGLSGPAILQISSYWQAGQALDINILPTQDLASLIKQAQCEQPSKTVKSLLTEHLPKRALEIFLSPDLLAQKLSSLIPKDIQQITTILQAWVIKPNGTEGYRTAEVTLGGVDCDSLSSKTMQANKVPGLFFIGEVVDVTGWLGGYNFQWAWSSGWAAGQVV